MKHEALYGRLGLLTLEDMSKSLPVGFKSGVEPILISEEQEIYLPPPWQAQQSNNVSMFQDWSTRIRDKLTGSLPNISQEMEFQSSCMAVIEAKGVKDDLEKKRDVLAKQQPVDEEALIQAKRAISDSEKDLHEKMDEAEVAAGKLLQRPDIQELLSDDYDDSDLVTYTVMMETTINKLAKWLDQEQGQGTQVLNFLNDVDFMRKFLQSGGAKNGEYPSAVKIYNQINPEPSSPVLHRLALAVALELCSHCPLFGIPENSVNPLKRYVHYETAYLLGELDPSFSQFNVWEMRHIVNSDATEEELSWGRRSLMNYRPDLAILDDPQWRYCHIVRCDVSYETPDWYKQPRSYDQILSGGGKCGPRAWYGRFICKAFGIPTWGVRQPAHAAMMRWTKEGWTTCLGGGAHKSHWDGENGLSFLLNTQAMRASESEELFMRKVRRLDWIAFFNNEDSRSVKSNLPNPKSLWWSLSLFQRKKLASRAMAVSVFMHPRVNITSNLISKLKWQPEKAFNEAITERDGKIIIPAAICSKPEKFSKKINLMRSFLGGKQILITDDGNVEYTIVAPFINETITKFNLTCSVCTVHRKGKPIILVVCSEGKDSEPIFISLPYTLGMWGETNPVIVELGGPNVKSTILRLSREKEPFGFALKHITLAPV